MLRLGPLKWDSQVALVVKSLPINAGDLKTQDRSLGWEDPLEEGMETRSSIKPGESNGQRSLVDYSPWGHKESDKTEAT